jgi:hypothetical protein
MRHHAQGGVCSAAGPRSRRLLVGRAASVLAAVAATGLAALGLTAAPALADACPNVGVRAQNNSTNLPDCRAYELVSNPFKEGFAPKFFQYADTGNVAYRSAGAFAGTDTGGTFNQYFATRSAAGWLTTAPGPPLASAGAESAYALAAGGSAEFMSADLRSSVWIMRRADEATDVGDFYLRGVDGVFRMIGPGVNPATLPHGVPGTSLTGVLPASTGAAADLSHVMFSILLGERFPGDTSSGQFSLYEYAGTGNDRPSLVGVDNAGQLISQTSTCAGSPTSRYHAMSTDGRVIFFTPNCPGTEGGVAQLWARIGGTTSVDVSASHCTRAPSDPGGACNAVAPAVFEGANADGSRVYFMTTQQLVDGDTDQTEDLYACDIPAGTPVPTGTANSCSALDEVSGSVSDANVEGVTRISDDGSRVYFVATGVLAGNLGASDVGAVAGDNNLYVWEKDAAHPAGQTTFVARLDPNDSSLWGGETGVFSGRAAQTTDDGRYLVLSTLSPLVTSGPTADTDAAADVYRYDAQTGAAMRLSVGADGSGGNEPGSGATISSVSYQTSDAATRARTVMTSDGQTVVFLTGEALSQQDTNGTEDVYEWHDGRVSLISTGTPSVSNPVGGLAWITASGHDIFINSTQRITSADGDTNIDFYDVRVDGGFDLTRPAPCTGDGCQGSAGRAPDASVTESDKAVGPGDGPLAAPTFSLQRVSDVARKRLASTGRITLRVSTSTSATLSAVATATVARRSVQVASARRVVAAAGTASLTLKLSKSARARLAADGKLTVKVLLSSSKVAVSQSAMLKLTHTKAKKTTSRPNATKPSVKRATAADKRGET